MQFLSKFQWHFSNRKKKKQSQNLCGTTKDSKKPNQSWERTNLEASSQFQIYYKTTVIKTVWYWLRNRYTDQWNRTECQEIKNMHISSLYLWRSQEYKTGQEQSLQWTVFGKLNIHMQMNESYAYTKVNSKWIKDLNVRPETIKVLNIGGKFLKISLGNDIFGFDNKSKNKQLGWHQIRKLLQSLENHYKMKRQLWSVRKYLQNICDKRLVSKIYKDLIQLNSKKPNSPIF